MTCLYHLTVGNFVIAWLSKVKRIVSNLFFYYTLGICTFFLRTSKTSFIYKSSFGTKARQQIVYFMYLILFWLNSKTFTHLFCCSFPLIKLGSRFLVTYVIFFGLHSKFHRVNLTLSGGFLKPPPHPPKNLRLSNCNSWSSYHYSISCWNNYLRVKLYQFWKGSKTQHNVDLTLQNLL